MKSVACWRQHADDSRKRGTLFLNNLVKSGNKDICCGTYKVLVNGKLVEKATMNLCFVLQQIQQSFK